MINKDTIGSARKQPLAEILISQGFELIDEGSGVFRNPKMGGMVIKDNYWYQHSSGLKGNTLDYLILINKVPFKDAVETALSLKQNPKINMGKSKEKCWTRKIKNIEYAQDFDRAEKYLLSRGISQDLLDDMFALGYIKQDIFNNVCFIGYDESHKARCISYRSTGTPRKGENSGSNKAYTFQVQDFHKHHKVEKTVIIAESPIDILSIATLENIKKQNGFYQTYKIATCGTVGKTLIERIQKLRPQKLFIAMDPDHQGQKMARRIEKELQHFTKIKNIILPGYLDPNEYLLTRLSSTS